ncbi:MAG: sigma-70 family RNA polymerase sigma factor [Myxococcota bacterium]
MTSDERTDVEKAVREHAQAGRYDLAITAALEQYGSEVLGYLHAVQASPADADETFSEVCERMWRALPAFEWKCSFRTWMYVIARNVARNRIRSRTRNRAREVPLSDVSEVARLAQKIRTETAAHLKTESRNRLREVRDSLEPDDRTLLVLRIDRKLPWSEIAMVLADDETLAGAQLSSVAARLRKRFERLKAKVISELREPQSPGMTR